MLHLHIFEYLLLLLGDFTLPGGRGNVRCPRECTKLRILGFSLNVTAQWSTIFKHALKIYFICLGFCCKTSWDKASESDPRHWSSPTEHYTRRTSSSLAYPAEFHPKFDTKRKILLVLLSQPREPVYTLSDVKQRGNGALLTNELAVSIHIQPKKLVYNSRQHHGDCQLGRGWWKGEI
jgi:hypothetical protein